MVVTVAFWVGFVGVPALAVACWIVGVVREWSLPPWLLALGLAGPILAVGLALYVSSDEGWNGATVSGTVFGSAAVAILTWAMVATAANLRWRRLATFIGLSMPAAVAALWLGFFLLVALNGGME